MNNTILLNFAHCICPVSKVECQMIIFGMNFPNAWYLIRSCRFLEYNQLNILNYYNTCNMLEEHWTISVVLRLSHDAYSWLFLVIWTLFTYYVDIAVTNYLSFILLNMLFRRPSKDALNGTSSNRICRVTLFHYPLSCL